MNLDFLEDRICMGEKYVMVSNVMISNQQNVNLRQKMTLSYIQQMTKLRETQELLRILSYGSCFKLAVGLIMAKLAAVCKLHINY